MTDTPAGLDEKGLLPCPHCNGAPRLLKAGPGNCYVRCDFCSASSDDGSEARATAAEAEAERLRAALMSARGIVNSVTVSRPPDFAWAYSVQLEIETALSEKSNG